MREIKVFENLEKLSRFAADRFTELAEKSIDQNGRFAVALTGGSSPRRLYELLASEEFRGRVDWSKIYFFIGDERNVPPDSEQSNFRLANETLFENPLIPPENIFRWKTEEFENAEETARDYEQTIRDFFGLNNAEDPESNLPRFDLIFFGMGDDGHVASLFPETDALDETEKIAVANFVEKLDATRLTFTYPAINNAANIIFLVSGEKKAEALSEVLEGEFHPEKLPAQNVRPVNGDLLWLIDKDGAKLLDS